MPIAGLKNIGSTQDYSKYALIIRSWTTKTRHISLLRAMKVDQERNIFATTVGKKTNTWYTTASIRSKRTENQQEMNAGKGRHILQEMGKYILLSIAH